MRDRRTSRSIIKTARAIFVDMQQHTLEALIRNRGRQIGSISLLLFYLKMVVELLQSGHADNSRFLAVFPSAFLKKLLRKKKVPIRLATTSLFIITARHRYLSGPLFADGDVNKQRGVL